MTTYLLAGGGTAGHVNPLLAVADRLRERNPDDQVLVLGTAEGLESRLVPPRGYELLTIAKVPVPRRPNRAAVAFPARFRKSIDAARTIIDEREQEIAGALRRMRLLRQARESRTPRTAGPLRSWLSGVLRGHRGRDLRPCRAAGPGRRRATGAAA